MRLLHAAEPLALYAGGVFVPTMGALHEGHAALIRTARTIGHPVVVSVFVNPTQFAPHEDFSRYPRTLDGDRYIAEQSGADVLFAPEVETIYPPHSATPVPDLPAVATEPGLEDAHRPTHFAGVCQVVARLFDLVRPSAAIFGEKDWQQLKVVEAMVADVHRSSPTRWGKLRIVACPTTREPDGLAMSSRNRFLKPEHRHRALGLSRALYAACLAKRPISSASIEKLMQDTLLAHGLTIDYAVVRDATTLMPITSPDRPVRGLIAAHLEGVRLIDNA